METDPSGRYQSAMNVANALADIDGSTLDWRLVETSGTRTWDKDQNGTIYQLRVTAAGQSDCFKTTGGGQQRRHGGIGRILWGEGRAACF